MTDPGEVEACVRMLVSGESLGIRRAAADVLERHGWRPAGDLTRAALAVARFDWDEAGRCGAAAARPLLAVLKEAGEVEFEADDESAFEAIQARDLMEALVRGHAARIETDLLRELAQSQVRICHTIRVIGRELSDHVCFDTETLGTTEHIAELARIELQRRGE